MTAEIPKPAEIRKTKGYLMRRTISKWPFLVWLGMALLTYQLYQRGVRFERMNGVIVAETQIITALEDGVIREMSVVESGEEVKPDQVVVQLDDRMLIAQKAQTKQEIEFKKIDDNRKFGDQKADFETKLAELEREYQGDVSRLALLDSILPDLKAKADAGSIPKSQWRDPHFEAEALRKSLPSYEVQRTQLKAGLGKVEVLIGELAAFHKQAPVSLEIIQSQIDRMALKSLAGGTVSQIYFRPGAAVKRGEPIVEILNTKVINAIGFIQEEDADKVSVGRQVFISPTGESTDLIYEGKITFISPQISSTPDIGSSVSGRMIKGREITCSFGDADVKLLPGQSISIHLEKPGKFELFGFGKK